MRKFVLSKKTESILITLSFCILGFLSIWIAKNSLGLEEETTYIAFLIFPILIYMVVSGRIVEFKAFGTEAKFSELAQKTIEPTLETIEASIREMEMLAKGGLSQLQRTQKSLSESTPVTLTLSLKRLPGHYYTIEALKAYIKALSQYRTFKGVVILNENEEYELYFPTQVIIRILEIRDNERFIDYINSSSIRELKHYPGAVTEKLTKHSTNIDALEKMTLQNSDTFVIVGEDRKPIGIVEREQIISKLLLAMAK